MSHEIETMMWTGEVPWHGLGADLGANPILAEDAIVAAGLDWTVEKRPALFRDAAEDIHTADNWYANVRTLDERVLGMVQGRYQIVQNQEAFDFMDKLAGVEKLVRYHTAGSLFGGRVVWLLAELTDLTFSPVAGDDVVPYLLFMNGHDGRTPVKVMFTTVRVVCNNTLNMALRTSSGGVTLRHTTSITKQTEHAKRVLGLATREVEAHKEVTEALQKKGMTDEQWKEFTRTILLPLPEDSNKPSSPQRTAALAALDSAWENGLGLDIPGVAGTAWAALNAVTAYTTHAKPVRHLTGDTRSAQELRLTSNWMLDTPNSLQNRALAALVAA